MRVLTPTLMLADCTTATWAAAASSAAEPAGPEGAAGDTLVIDAPAVEAVEAESTGSEA